MFEKLRAQWNEARGSQLREEYDDTALRIKRLTEEGNERFCKSLNYAFDKWTTDHGPIERWRERLRKDAVKELRSFAKQRLDDGDFGVSYGVVLLAFHVEASYLPGADAMEVYQSTSDWISLSRAIVQKMAGHASPDA
jgi:hypothetical protein